MMVFRSRVVRVFFPAIAEKDEFSEKSIRVHQRNELYFWYHWILAGFAAIIPLLLVGYLLFSQFVDSFSFSLIVYTSTMDITMEYVFWILFVDTGNALKRRKSLLNEINVLPNAKTRTFNILFLSVYRKIFIMMVLSHLVLFCLFLFFGIVSFNGVDLLFLLLLSVWICPMIWILFQQNNIFVLDMIQSLKIGFAGWRVIGYLPLRLLFWGAFTLLFIFIFTMFNGLLGHQSAVELEGYIYLLFISFICLLAYTKHGHCRDEIIDKVHRYLVDEDKS